MEITEIANSVVFIKADNIWDEYDGHHIIFACKYTFNNVEYREKMLINQNGEVYFTNNGTKVDDDVSEITELEDIFFDQYGLHFNDVAVIIKAYDAIINILNSCGIDENNLNIDLKTKIINECGSCDSTVSKEPFVEKALEIVNEPDKFVKNVLGIQPKQNTGSIKAICEIQLLIDKQPVHIEWENSYVVKDFKILLEEGTIKSDISKQKDGLYIGKLEKPLSKEDSGIKTNIGDLICTSKGVIAISYAEKGWKCTRLGTIDEEDLKNLFSKSKSIIEFSIDLNNEDDSREV